MNPEAKKLFELLFEPGETVSVTSGQYSAHSIRQDEINECISLRTPENQFTISKEQIQLVAVNPINGWKRDENVTSHRNFMIELDDGTIEEQMQYVKSSGLPYSACIYSGNKSLHYAVATEDDYGETIWRYVMQWMLNILKKADQQNKSPSRGIRVPGNRRRGGLGKMQTLEEYNKKITHEQINNWLSKHMDKKPVIDRPTIPEYGKIITIADLPASIVSKLNRLYEGMQENRNESWFSVAAYMALNGVDRASAEEICEMYFVEESDFKKRELLSCIKSAYKDK